MRPELVATSPSKMARQNRQVAMSTSRLGDRSTPAGPDQPAKKGGPQAALGRCFPDLFLEPPQENGVLSPGLEILEQVGECGSDYASPVRGGAELGAQAQPGTLEAHQVLSRAVEGHLLVVLGSLPIDLGRRLGRLGDL